MDNKNNSIPLSVIRKNLKVKWYRCPIDKKILKELSSPSDFKGFIYALGHLGLWFGTGTLTYVFFIESNWLGFTIAIFLHGTVGSFFSAPQHELNHGTVFRTKKLNDFFLFIYSLLGWLDCKTYALSHTYHHRYTLHNEGDYEEVHPKIPSLNIFYLIQLFSINITGGEKSYGFVPTVSNFVKIAFNNLNNPFNDWDFRLYAELKNEGEKAVIWARTVLIFHIFVLIVSFSINQPILALIISGHRFIGNGLYYFVGTPMHCGLRTNVPDFRKCVRSITLEPISEFLYWNMNWHLEHHMYASIPCYNLKKIHRLISNECPKPKNIFGAWKEMREIYSKQQKDSKYEFDTHVPSTTNLSNSKQENIDIEESLGDLAPKALN